MTVSKWPTAWWWLSRQQKQRYLQFRMGVDPESGRHLWPQNSGDPEMMAIAGGHHVGFIEKALAVARRQSHRIVRKTLEGVWRGY